MADDDQTDEQLPIATGDEVISGESLQPTIDALRAMAKALDDAVADAPDVETMQAIGHAQNDLTSQAMRLVGAQIRLVAGQAAVSALHVNAAARYAQEAIAKIADARKKIVAAGKVVDFIGACLTGDGLKIVESAVKLKDVLV